VGHPLADETHRLLLSLDSSSLASVLELWPRQGVSREPAVPRSLPVLSCLPQVARQAPPFSQSLCGALCAAAATLAWRQTYTLSEATPAFLERYGWCELVGPHGALPSEQLACGWLLLGPDTLYPSHRHEADELYVPLSGNAQWQQSDRGWRRQPPGVVIRHASCEPHAMRTDRQPLLALYLWRGANLRLPARLEAS